MCENGRDAKRQVGELADALLRGARDTRCVGGSFGDGALPEEACVRLFALVKLSTS